MDPENESLSEKPQPTTPSTCPSDNSQYKPPDWALPCPNDTPTYHMEVIKSGIPLPDCMVKLSRPDSDCSLSFCLFGRQPQSFLASHNDLEGQCVVLAHPSVSRLHAVLQFGQAPVSIARTSLTKPDDPGWYVQDLNSTHGTFINKRRLPPGKFVRIHVGHVIRFGGSTRLHILQGPIEDIEDESKQTWSEIKETYLARKLETIVAKNLSASATAVKSKNTGCSWGFKNDLESDPSSQLNEAACVGHEHLYREDPRRALRAYFEREAIDPEPEFTFSDASIGMQHCKIELPLVTGTVTAEVSVPGKRKEAMAACALEACRLLDRLGEFDTQDGKRGISNVVRNKSYWEDNDYYSSDDDTFADRTGHIERKRLNRIRQFGVTGKTAELAEKQLSEITVQARPSATPRCSEDASILLVLSQLEELGNEIVKLEEEIDQIDNELNPHGENPSELDELEAYMNGLKSGAPNRKERQKLKSKLFHLRQLEKQLNQKVLLSRMRTGTMTMNAGVSAGQSSIDAAAAVRAAKRKLDDDSTTEEDKPSTLSINRRLNIKDMKRALGPITKPSDTTDHTLKDHWDTFVPEVEEADEEDVCLNEANHPSGPDQSTDETMQINVEPCV